MSSHTQALICGEIESWLSQSSTSTMSVPAAGGGQSFTFLAEHLFPNATAGFSKKW